MSTTKGSYVSFKRDLDPDGPTYHLGQLMFHHTSDTVTWQVDDEDRFIMGNGEFTALLNANEELDHEPVPIDGGASCAQAPTLEDIKFEFAKLTDDQRHDVMSGYCKFCGTSEADFGCQCGGNDE